MIAVLLAGLLEYQVRRHVAHTGELVRGLMPKNYDNPHPTAKRCSGLSELYPGDRSLPDGREEIHYPKLRPFHSKSGTSCISPGRQRQP